MGLCADSSDPVSPSLCPSPAHALSLSKINIKKKKTHTVPLRETSRLNHKPIHLGHKISPKKLGLPFVLS